MRRVSLVPVLLVLFLTACNGPSAASRLDIQQPIRYAALSAE